VLSAPAAGAEYAELVTLWISQHDPRLVALAYVRPGRSQREHPLNLSVPIVRSEVQMESVLNHLWLTNAAEQQTRESVCCWSNFKLFRIVIHHNPTKCLLPPAPESSRISRVNDRLFPVQAHPLKLGAPPWVPNDPSRTPPLGSSSNDSPVWAKRSGASFTYTDVRYIHVT
jgi:hypothetical protein